MKRTHGKVHWSKLKYVFTILCMGLLLQAHIAFAVEFGTEQVDLEVVDTYDSSPYYAPVLIGNKLLVSWEPAIKKSR